MIQNVKQYIDRYVTMDEPIPYKGLEIKPILVKDAFDFLFSFDILTVEKNKIPDIEVIQMTYLDFVMKKLIKDKTAFSDEITVGEIWIHKFTIIMKLCLGVEPHEIKIIQDNGKISLTIKNENIDSNEFDEIRKIIMYQNIDEYDDEEMSDDFREVVEQYYNLKNKNINQPSFEDKKDIILTNTSYNNLEITKLTYRRFERLFNKIVGKTDFIVNAIFKSQGADQPLEHWVYKTNKKKYGEIFSDADSFTEEFSK